MQLAKHCCSVLLAHAQSPHKCSTFSQSFYTVSSGPASLAQVKYKGINNLSNSVLYKEGLSLTIDYRPTEKGLETPQIYPGIDVTIRNKSALRLYGEIALPAQHIPKSCKLVKQRAKLVRLSRQYFSRDL